MPYRKWTTGENMYLMEHGHRIPWSEIARNIDRTEAACKSHYEKIKKLRIHRGTWKGI